METDNKATTAASEPMGTVVIGNAVGNFELSEAARNELNVNKDLSDKGSGTSGKTNDDSKKEGEKATSTATTGDDAKANEKASTENEDDSGKEQRDDSDGDFKEKIWKKLDAFDDEEKRATLLRDLENYEKFQAGNTNMRKALANAGGKEAVEALETLSKIEDINEVMESLDDWYDGKDKNPFRRLVDSLNAVAPKAKKQREDNERLSQQEMEIALEKEILSLRKIDPAIGDGSEDGNKRLAEIGELADARGVNLMTAFEIQQSGALRDTVKALKDDLSKARKELKERNAELVKLRETSLPGPGAVGGDGAAGFDVISSEDISFDAIQAKVNKKLGVE